MLSPEQKVPYFHYNRDQWEAAESEMITEAAVSLTVNGEVWLTFLCTPALLEALAVGFLYNEGVVQSMEEIANIHMCDNGSNVDVWLRKSVQKPAHWKRTSGCTGGISRPDAPIPNHAATQLNLSPQRVLACMDQLYQAQELYRETGGVHCSGISDGEALHVKAEDIGRHNTLDKIAGQLLLNNINVQPKILLTTGRVSSEMVQKSARMGAAVVVSRTSPSTLSIALADRLGITLVGYARRAYLNVYTHPERLAVGPLNVPQPGSASLPG